MGDWISPLPQLAGTNLTSVDVYTSSVLDVELEAAWRAAADWARSSWLKGGRSLTFSVINLGTAGDTQVGSTRALRIGNAQIFEQLTARDDNKHLLRWKLISHPQTISPFESASFINYVSSIHFRPVTATNQTFVEWKAHVFTEPQNAMHVLMTLENWYDVALKDLQNYVLQAPVMKQGSFPGAHLLPPFTAPLTAPVHLAQPFIFPGPFQGVPSASGVGTNPQDQQKQRFVGTLDEASGIPSSFTHAPEPIAEQGYRGGPEPYAQTPVSAFEEINFPKAAPAKQAQAVPPSINHTLAPQRLRSGIATNRLHKEVLPQGPGPPSSRGRSSSGSRMSCNTQATDSGSSSGGSNTDRANSRSLSSGSEKDKQEIQLNREPTAKLWASGRQGSLSQPQVEKSRCLQSDDDFMEQLASQLRRSHPDDSKADRRSFEDLAAQLEERHRSMQRNRTAPVQSPFSTPFAPAIASPFAAMTEVPGAIPRPGFGNLG